VVYCSGATPIDPSTGEVRATGDVAGQAEFVYGELDGLLREAGANGLHDVVKTVEFVAPAAGTAYRQVGQVRERLLGRPFPASTGVVCAALLRPDWLIEVDATAVVATGEDPA
jgi:enamine deaminase RidA (YjgF/YER057c/UK114 family)